jgi:hypothetical protein
MGDIPVTCVGKKKSEIKISVMPLKPLYSPNHGISFITVMEATVF